MSVSPLGLPAWRACCHLGSDREVTGKSQAGGHPIVSSGRWVIISGVRKRTRMECSDGRRVQDENVSLYRAQTHLFYLERRPWLSWLTGVVPGAPCCRLVAVLAGSVRSQASWAFPLLRASLEISCCWPRSCKTLTRLQLLTETVTFPLGFRHQLITVTTLTMTTAAILSQRFWGTRRVM